MFQKIDANGEMETRKLVKKAARDIDLMSLMGMNRHERRALAKINRINKIDGSNRPITNEKGSFT